VSLRVANPGRFSSSFCFNSNSIISETSNEFVKFIITQKNENKISKFLEKKDLSNKNII
jgi:hypothetical protein